MAHLKIQPAGQMPLDPGDRKPVIKVIGGDTWRVSLNLYNPADVLEPATPDNTVVIVKLAETQFDDTIWTGEWFSGVMPDKSRRGLCYIVVPMDVTKRLRRGNYMFSVKVSDLLKTCTTTEAEGSFLVEYKPTSDQHSIPYKDGTSEADGHKNKDDEDENRYLVDEEGGKWEVGVTHVGALTTTPVRRGAVAPGLSWPTEATQAPGGE